MWFSLLLPLYLLLLSRRVWWPVGLGAITAFIVYQGGHRVGVYLPLFGIGVVLAQHRDPIGRLFRRLPAGVLGHAVWVALAAVAVTAVNLQWVMIGQGWHMEPHLQGALTVLGVALVIEVALHWGVAATVLGSRAGQWLGRRSFSLYLVHYPIVISIAVLLGPARQHQVLLVALPTALVAAEVFYRAAEGPSHRLSQWLRRAVSARGRDEGSPRAAS